MNSYYGTQSFRITKYNGINNDNKDDKDDDDDSHTNVEFIKVLQNLHQRQEELLKQLTNMEGSSSMGDEVEEDYWNNNEASDNNVEDKANRLDDILLKLGKKWLIKLDWQNNKGYDGLIRLDKSKEDCMITSWVDNGKKDDDTIEAIEGDNYSLLATLSSDNKSSCDREGDSSVVEYNGEVLDNDDMEGGSSNIVYKVDGSSSNTDVAEVYDTTSLIDNIQPFMERYSDRGCVMDNNTIITNMLNEGGSTSEEVIEVMEENDISSSKRRREELQRLNNKVKNKLLQLTINERRLPKRDNKDIKREEQYDNSSYRTIREYRNNVIKIKQLIMDVSTAINNDTCPINNMFSHE